MIGDALLITAGAFVVAIAFLGWGTWLTSRHERVGAPRPGVDPP